MKTDWRLPVLRKLKRLEVEYNASSEVFACYKENYWENQQFEKGR